MNVKETAERVRKGDLSPEALVGASLDKIIALKSQNAFISVLETSARHSAAQITQKIREGKPLGRLAGIPIAVKDNIVMREGKTTCASRLLKNFQSPYNATVIERLLKEDAVIVGKTNLDEFAMGSSTEFSAFGRTINPRDPEVIPGGSSGGSAAAVASGAVSLALGSDTGGSIRQPAACCGIVGMKPTYGRVSRYGLVAFASSLDQIGPFSTCVEDSAYLLNIIAGTDEHDHTSARVDLPDFTEKIGRGIQGMTFGVPRAYFEKGLCPQIRETLQGVLEQLEAQGASIADISLPFMEYGVAAYYIIATAEASSNLSRYDGIRYTERAAHAEDLIDVYKKSRAEGFGKEVKRRIILGTHVLSAGFYDAYYMQAQKVRRKITEDFNTAFARCNAVVLPTMPDAPSAPGVYEKEPLKAYLGDIYTVSANLAGLPAISLPVRQKSGGVTGIQFIGKSFEEAELFQIASEAEKAAA